MAKTCPRCAGTGQTAYHWVLNGVCFLCKGMGEISAETRKLSAMERAVEEIEIHTRDIEDRKVELRYRKDRAIKCADRLVARGKAKNRADAFQTMIDDNSMHVTQVKHARRALASSETRLKLWTKKLNRLQSA